MPRLYIYSPDGQSREIAIDSNYIQIGRGADTDIQLDGTGVSEKHAILQERGGVLTLHDMSLNGTVVAGKKVHNDSTVVQEGAEIRISRWRIYVGQPPARVTADTVVEEIGRFSSPAAGVGSGTRMRSGVEAGVSGDADADTVVTTPGGDHGKLVVIAGRDRDNSQPVGDGMVVGRAPGSGRLVLSDPTVSKEHAILNIEGKKVFIQNRSGTANTYVGTKAATTPIRLYHKDRIRVGDTELQYDNPKQSRWFKLINARTGVAALFIVALAAVGWIALGQIEEAKKREVIARIETAEQTGAYSSGMSLISTFQGQYGDDTRIASLRSKLEAHLRAVRAIERAREFERLGSLKEALKQIDGLNLDDVPEPEYAIVVDLKLRLEDQMNEGGLRERADDFFRLDDYKRAKAEYQKLADKYPDNEYYKKRIDVCEGKIRPKPRPGELFIPEPVLVPRPEPTLPPPIEEPSNIAQLEAKLKEADEHRQKAVIPVNPSPEQKASARQSLDRARRIWGEVVEATRNKTTPDEARLNRLAQDMLDNTRRWLQQLSE